MPRDQPAELHGAAVNEWTNVVRRARLGRTTKLVALMLATYADSDGSKVFPGVARLVVQCEISHSRARAGLANLRQAGLIERVRQGNRRRGQADEYRLTFSADLLERITVLTPDEEREAIDRVQGIYASAAASRQRRAKDLRPAVSVEVSEDLRPSESAQAHVLRPRVGVEVSASTPIAVGVETTIYAHREAGSTPATDPPPSIGPLPDTDPPSQLVALGTQPQDACAGTCRHWNEARDRSALTIDGDCLRCGVQGLCEGCVRLQRKGDLGVRCYEHQVAS